jgi:TolB protein
VRKLRSAIFGAGGLAAGVLALVLVASAAGVSRGADGRIVFVTNRYCGGRQEDCGRGELATVRADGSGVRVLTRNAVSEGSPAWSPNGEQIAFFRPKRQVWLMNADGSHQRQLTHLNRVQFYGELDWSPDGQTIVIKAFPSSLGGQTELWLVNARGGAVSRLTATATSEAGPAWSPNGRWIAFFTEGRGSPQIWRLSTTTRRAVRLSSGSPAALYPSWSPDSRRIAFTLGGRLAVMDADGRHKRTLRLFGTHPHWSSDGRWLVFVANGDLFKARPDGTGRTQLTHHGKQVVNDQPDW